MLKKKLFRSFSKIKHLFIILSSYFIIRYMPTNKNVYMHKNLRANIHAASFVIGKNLKQPNVHQNVNEYTTFYTYIKWNTALL